MADHDLPGDVVRVVSDEEVGELCRLWLRGMARALADRHNAGDPRVRPVEYRVERRGRRWAVVAYQAYLYVADEAARPRGARCPQDAPTGRDVA